ncbi:hypothetical protein [Lelliottia wanjuensis]|uniref:Uncharacterized protein n=1 Tax=Lelliottia wanjuensis TaxID=3050585 RepID=A0AAP4FW05_9ENTR|nr:MULTISPECIES: hypothetical protein [unclassified Lelliottia]MDK9361957.1 hypothetical protein [Lelliottia sp. V106_12]MDK9584318.1 hypothetical protein [Lelliottia sp. V86_10]MDK9617357.1 hypothetical protein [Lelliottia sp. V106_9]
MAYYIFINNKKGTAPEFRRIMALAGFYLTVKEPPEIVPFRHYPDSLKGGTNRSAWRFRTKGSGWLPVGHRRQGRRMLPCPTTLTAREIKTVVNSFWVMKID